MLLKITNTDLEGNPRDLIDLNTDTVVFPFSNGSVLCIYLSNNMIYNDFKVDLDQENESSLIYNSFMKLYEYNILNTNIANESLKALFLCQMCSNIIFVDDLGKEIKCKGIEIEVNEKYDYHSNINIQITTDEISIGGNY